MEKKKDKKETNEKNINKTSKKNTKIVSKKKQVKKEVKHTSFFKDALSELKKVRWPLKKEMIKYSIATLIVIILMGVFFIATDLIVAGIKMVFV